MAKGKGFGVQIKVTGLKPALQALRRLKPAVQRKILRAEISKVARVIAKDAKARSPVRTGLLKKSLGVKMRTYTRRGVVYAAVGPRTGFRTQIGVRTRGKSKGSPVFANPTNYAHLVELGTNRGVRARHFLLAALEANAQRAIAQLRDGIYAGIEREAARAAAKGAA